MLFTRAPLAGNRPRQPALPMKQCLATMRWVNLASVCTRSPQRCHTAWSWCLALQNVDIHLRLSDNLRLW